MNMTCTYILTVCIGSIALLHSLQVSAAGKASGRIEDWQNPAIFERNRLQMRSSFKTDSPTLSLNGLWKFNGTQHRRNVPAISFLLGQMFPDGTRCLYRGCGN